MSPEKLHQLVLSMNKDQKSYFRRHFQGSKKTLDILLYDRLLKTPELTKEALVKVRGKEFKKPSNFHYYRILLGEKIIQSLVAHEGAGTSPIPFIEKAVAMDLPELARKELEKQLLMAQEKENFVRMNYLFQFRAGLVDSFQEKLPVSEAIMTLEELNGLIGENESLTTLIELGREALKLKPSERLLFANRIHFETDKLNPQSLTGKRLKLKAVALKAILMEDYESGHKSQTQLIKLAEEKSILVPSRFWYLKELVQLFSLSLATSKKAICFELRQRIQDFEPQNLKETILKEKELLRVSRDVADYYCSEEIASFGVERFERNEQLFSPAEQSLFYLFFASTFFHSENWSKCLFCIQKIKEIHPRNWDKRISWEVEAIKCLVLAETEDFDGAESTLRSLKRRLSEVEEQFPSETYSVIKDYVFSGGQMDSEKLIETQKALSALLSRSNEKRAALFFNIQFWIEGKIHKVSPSQIISEFGKNSEKAIAV